MSPLSSVGFMESPSTRARVNPKVVSRYAAAALRTQARQLSREVVGAHSRCRRVAHGPAPLVPRGVRPDARVGPGVPHEAHWTGRVARAHELAA